MLLDDIKVVLGKESDLSIDNLLNVYIRKGTTLINNYMNFPDIPITIPITLPVDVAVVYADALIEYVILNYRKKGNEGVKSFGQGNRSATYEDGLQESVKALLPSPYIKMMGVRRYDYGL